MSDNFYVLLDSQEKPTEDIDKVCWLAVSGEGEPIRVGRRNLDHARPALKAVARVKKFNAYGPDAKVGFHPMPGVKVVRGWAEDYAVVQDAEAPFGWSMLSYQNGREKFVPVNEARGYAHDVADSLLEGGAVWVWVAHLRGVLPTFLTNWEMDLEDAKADRNERIAKRIESNALYRVQAPLIKNGRDVEKPEDAGNGAPKGNLMVRKVGGGRVNLYTLAEGTQVGIMSGNDQLYSLPWKPGDPLLLESFQALADPSNPLKVRVPERK